MKASAFDQNATMVNMTQYLSDKLKVLSLASMMLVLYIHSRFYDSDIVGMPANKVAQEMIAGMIGRCAVPLFFVISGWLFFRSLPNGVRSVWKKMQKRVKTLLVPYIVGSLFCVVFSVAVALAPGTAKYINSSIMPLFQESIGKILCSIFYVSDTGLPVAYQLWFLRDLILIVATAPLWYYALSYLRWGFVVAVFALTYLHIPYVPTVSLFWFALGGQLSTVDVEGKKLIRGGQILAPIFLFLSVLQVCFGESHGWKVGLIPIELMGVLSIWGIYNTVVRQDFVLKEHKWLATACNYTFFIYLFHVPTINIVRKLIVTVIGKTSVGFMLSYVASPWLFAVAAIFVGMMLRRYMEKVYLFCTGGR